MPLPSYSNILARFCLPIGKTLPPRWQKFAIGVAKVCQSHDNRLAKLLYCVYHGRTKNTGNERMVFIDPAEIQPDGKLVVHGPNTDLQEITY
jgi:hypothetical protein